MTNTPKVQAARDALYAFDNHTPLTGPDGFPLIGSVERAEYIINQIRPLIESVVERFNAGDIVAHVSDPGASFGVVEFGDETGANVIEHGSDTAWFVRQDIERIGTVKERLEELRAELRAERISYGELAELQGLVQFIDPSDTELLEAAGVPESE